MEASLLPGPARLGRYRLLRRIGRGGMSTVYHAVQEGPHGFENEVAIKLLDPELVGKYPHLIRSLVDEARVAARIHHPNVVRILDLVDEGERVYMVMDLVDGVSLKQVLDRARLARTPPPLAPILSVLADACVGLHAAHKLTGPEGELLRLVHRDVKPGNILISHTGIVKVSDFGIARFDDRDAEHTDANQMKGTPAYMAPEQCLGDPVDHRADIFSMGLTLYTMATTRLAFDSESPLAIALMIARKPLDRHAEELERILPGMGPVFARATAKDPTQRYQSARRLGEAIKALHARCEQDGSVLELVAWGGWAPRSQTHEPSVLLAHVAGLTGDLLDAESEPTGAGPAPIRPLGIGGARADVWDPEDEPTDAGSGPINQLRDGLVDPLLGEPTGPALGDSNTERLQAGGLGPGEPGGPLGRTQEWVEEPTAVDAVLASLQVGDRMDPEVTPITGPPSMKAMMAGPPPGLASSAAVPVGGLRPPAHTAAFRPIRSDAEATRSGLEEHAYQPVRDYRGRVVGKAKVDSGATRISRMELLGVAVAFVALLAAVGAIIWATTQGPTTVVESDPDATPFPRSPTPVVEIPANRSILARNAAAEGSIDGAERPPPTEEERRLAARSRGAQMAEAAAGAVAAAGGRPGTAAPVAIPGAPERASARPTPETPAPSTTAEAAPRAAAPKPTRAATPKPAAPTPAATPTPTPRPTPKPTAEPAPEEPAPVAAAPPGRLTVSTYPYAQVSVDGVGRGRTPVRGLELPPGPHKLRLIFPTLGDKVVEETVQIASDKDVRVVRKLDVPEATTQEGG